MEYIRTRCSAECHADELVPNAVYADGLRLRGGTWLLRIHQLRRLVRFLLFLNSPWRKCPVVFGFLEAIGPVLDVLRWMKNGWANSVWSFLQIQLPLCFIMSVGQIVTYWCGVVIQLTKKQTDKLNSGGSHQRHLIRFTFRLASERPFRIIRRLSIFDSVRSFTNAINVSLFPWLVLLQIWMCTPNVFSPIENVKQYFSIRFVVRPASSEIVASETEMR